MNVTIISGGKIMKRVLIIGCPGSGKSTFARKLHKITSIPLHHLDMLNWNSDKTVVEKEVFIERLNKVLETETWIIDGNYLGTMASRMKDADTVFFLDYDLETCLSGVQSRKGQPRADMPWIETETDPEFIEFIKTFHIESRPKILELLEENKHKEIIVFKNRSESDKYILKLTMLQLEGYHLDKENRKSGKYVEVLHPDFKEYGQSGAIYHLADFKGIPLKDASEYEISKFFVKELSEDNRLCTYTLLNKTTGNESNRSSVWVRVSGDWKLLFHQGTTVK